MLTNIVFIIQSFVPKKFFPLISGRSAFLYNGTTGTPREGAKRKAGRNYLQSNVKKKNTLWLSTKETAQHAHWGRQN